MPTIRTTNRRAKAAPGKEARRYRRALKTARFAYMYSMSPAHPTIRGFVDRYFRYEGPLPGTVTGRMVSRHPEPQYQMPKSRPFVRPAMEEAWLNIDWSDIERRVAEQMRGTSEAFRELGRAVLKGMIASKSIRITGKALENYRRQEETAHRMHREELDRLRAEGHGVIEHTSADATVIMKGKEDE